jgi:hypothetical protein
MTGRRFSLSAKAGVLMISAILLLSSLVLFQPLIAAASSCNTTYSASPTYDTATMVPITITSPGTYCFGAGIYNTQITITASGVTLTAAPGVRPGQAVIEPTTVASNSNNVPSGTPGYSIILAGSDSASTTGVTISNLVVDGSKAASSITSCQAFPAGDYNGILFLNAGGTITGDTVQNLYLPVTVAASCQLPNTGRLQPGNGIVVMTGSGFSSSVTISSNRVLNYENIGVFCIYVGTTCSITENAVSDAGTPYSAFNAPTGIFINGVVGTVSRDIASGNECNIASICGVNVITQVQASGIIAELSGAGTTIDQNTLVGNDAGISLFYGTTTSSNNQLLGNRVVALYVTDGATTVSNNQISGSTDIGIGVDSDGCVDSPTTANLMGNNFNQGTYSTAPVQVMTLSDPAFCTYIYGGPSYQETATVNLNGLVETVSGGTLGSCPPLGPCPYPSSLSVVNLNDFPGLRSPPP